MADSRTMLKIVGLLTLVCNHVSITQSYTYSTNFSVYDSANWDLYNNNCQHCSEHNGTQCCLMSNKSVTFGSVFASNNTGATFTTTRLSSETECGALCKSGYLLFKKELLYADITLIAKWFPQSSNKNDSISTDTANINNYNYSYKHKYNSNYSYSYSSQQTGQGYIGIIAIDEGSSTIFGFHAEYSQWPYQLTTNTYTKDSGTSDSDEKINTKYNLSGEFNTYRLIWTNKSIEWMLNGQVIRKETNKKYIPSIPMQLRLHDRSQNCPQMNVGQTFIAQFANFECNTSD